MVEVLDALIARYSTCLSNLYSWIAESGDAYAKPDSGVVLDGGYAKVLAELANQCGTTAANFSSQYANVARFLDSRFEKARSAQWRGYRVVSVKEFDILVRPGQ